MKRDVITRSYIIDSKVKDLNVNADNKTNAFINITSHDNTIVIKR